MARFDKLHWEPRVENKYSLNWESIKTLQVKNRNLLKEFSKETPLGNVSAYRNDIIEAWCFTDATSDRMAENQFWIGIYDEDSTKSPHRWNVNGNFDFHLTSYCEMMHYCFETFFDPEEINGDRYALEIQEKFLATLNVLLDCGILELPK